ncbi:hypothetical protein CU633_22405 [Bacillus sp. V3-13]|uniref:polymorphic toxin type 44 domain-containing protein n=1 Tax=Bacillus sp. V3-13 TaxID=2053728 RepID=UPI000C78C70F|nr:polymorphic toxin type 44 domain-containing protein [Bacillus sp. V3-13]PLR75200.1 hypothetical protein CU633_22405 [Bacillus sp. V3-13]
MKKAILFSLFVIGYFLFPPDITNAASNFSEIKTTQELHQELKDEKLIYLDENGLIKIPDNLSSLGVNQDLFDKYINMVNITNQQIQDGIISMDKELNVKPFTIEEIADKIYENDKKNDENNISFSTLSTSSYLDLVDLVETNRDELEAIYNTQATFNPSGAYNFTVGWWVGKVREDGDWDYKVQPGFSPWYKTFNMAHYNGIVEEHNSKWLGNYNYGYTGEFLFSLSVLLAGGDAISYLINWEPDTPEAKEAIEWGYSDAYYFY